MAPPKLSQRLRTAATFCELFQATAAEYPYAVALRTPDDSVRITWQQYAQRVRRIAAGLAALGVSRGDTVAIMLTNRPEFHLVDTAAYHLGAAPYSIYNTSPVDQVAHLFANSGTSVVICEEQFLPTVRKAQEVGDVEHVVVLEGGADVLSLAELEAAGADDFDFESAWRAVEPDDLLTLIYTSGTTGPPKGVELTHRSVLFFTRTLLGQPEMADADGGRVVSYLPDAHALNRWLGQYGPAATGSTVTTIADLRDLIDVLPTVRPTFFVAVPMLWYKLQAAVENAVAAEHGPRKAIATWALEVGRQRVRHEVSGRGVPVALHLQHALAQRLVLSKLTAKIGLDRVTLALTGAAPIAVETLEFVLSLSIPCCEAWGMSEILIVTMNPSAAVRPGTVGKALPGSEIKVGADGELLVRTPGVMRGYRDDPERTAETIDSDGWVHTGDIGTIDADGYISIVDRKKELIINSAGKNISPSNIESAIKTACPLVGSAVAIGDRRKYITALIALDQDAAANYAREHGLPDASAAALAADPTVHAQIEAGIAKANAKLARVEQARAFTILPTFWEPGSDELTPTMKLKRQPIAAKYAAEIDALYASTTGA